MTDVKARDEGGEDDGKSFEALGLDARLVRALAEKAITRPTPIQSVAIPPILEGKDAVVQAKTGSGKTYAYLVPLLHNCFIQSPSKKVAPNVFVLVPTRELCQQVYSEIFTLLELCGVQFKVVQITSDMRISDMRAVLAGVPDILVSTPACISTCMSEGVFFATSLRDSLSVLVLDEADLLLSYGYEDDLKAFAVHIPQTCQCLLMTVTLSADIEKLKTLVLHDPCVLTPPASLDVKSMNILENVDHFWISCRAHDKFLHGLALLMFELIEKKVLLFVGTVDMAYKLKIFLEKFGIRSAVLNAALPHNSRIRIVQGFNAGLSEYLIVTDDVQMKDTTNDSGRKSLDSKKYKKYIKRRPIAKLGAGRGIGFNNVKTIINCELPQSPADYVDRVGHTGRDASQRAVISLVSPDENQILEKTKSFLVENGKSQHSSMFMAEFSLLSTKAVESLRYRAEDVARSVTKVAVQEARARDLRNEIINSEKLKAHFEDNPRDLDLLKHDRPLRKNLRPLHLQSVPSYLIDPTTREASKIVKLAALTMDKVQPRRKLFRGGDSFRTSFTQSSKKWLKGGKKRKDVATNNLQHKSKRKVKVSG